MVIDVAKRTGRGLTMDLNYTLSRQEGNTWSAMQEGNGYYTGIQDFDNVGESAHNVTGYDQTHVVKGYVSYELPFGHGQRWLGSQGRILNRVVSGWTVAGIIQYYSGPPFEISVPNPYWPQWGNFYPNYNLSGFNGPSDPGKFQVPQEGQPIPTGNFYIPASVASAPPIGQLGKGPATNSDLRCPGAGNENVTLLKNVPFGTDNRYKLSFRAEFYNVFNRHQYSIQGCSSLRSTIGADNFGQILGVADNPRTGQFAIRFDF
jgi:hypothetical protein